MPYFVREILQQGRQVSVRIVLSRTLCVDRAVGV